MKTYTTSCSTRWSPLEMELNSTPTIYKSAWKGEEIEEKAGTISGFENVALCGVERNAEDSNLG